MKTIFITVALFISNWCTAQLNIGPVKADTNYNHIAPIDWLKTDFPEIKDLIDSKDELEIRVSFGCPRPLYNMLYIFICNDSTWSIREYEKAKTSGFGYRTASVKYDYIYQYDAYSSLFFNMLDTLKQKNAFTLVSQDKLNVQGQVFDGAGYSFSFKYKNIVGGYGCYAPAEYVSGNPDIKELQEYADIQTLIWRTFKQFDQRFR